MSFSGFIYTLDNNGENSQSFKYRATLQAQLLLLRLIFILKETKQKSRNAHQAMFA